MYIDSLFSDDKPGDNICLTMTLKLRFFSLLEAREIAELDYHRYTYTLHDKQTHPSYMYCMLSHIFSCCSTIYSSSFSLFVSSHLPFHVYYLYFFVLS